jgi:hypothetical protein
VGAARRRGEAGRGVQAWRSPPRRAIALSSSHHSHEPGRRWSFCVFLELCNGYLPQESRRPLPPKSFAAEIRLSDRDSRTEQLFRHIASTMQDPHHPHRRIVRHETIEDQLGRHWPDAHIMRELRSPRPGLGERHQMPKRRAELSRVAQRNGSAGLAGLPA